jgi:isopenicillin N synthase-like dioxygenase
VDDQTIIIIITMTKASPNTSDRTTNSTIPISPCPVIDLSQLQQEEEEQGVIEQIARACRTHGFFQVVGHGVDPRLVRDFRTEMGRFFRETSREQKDSMRRSHANSRGYFDDELTQRRRDWKECLDAGVPGSRRWDLDDSDPLNTCLDGFNRFPPAATSKSRLRQAFVPYFEACATLADRVASLMAAGLSLPVGPPRAVMNLSRDDDETVRWLRLASDEFLQQMRNNHTSYLRLNYYPPCTDGGDDEDDDEAEKEKPRPLGVRYCA